MKTLYTTRTLGAVSIRALCAIYIRGYEAKLNKKTGYM